MRLDKFLKVSRILKRRSVANEACDGGRVEVNGRRAKPSHQLKVGDVVCIHFAAGQLQFRVLLLAETVRKEDADKMYEVV
ncbi:MAG: RNA-binding S4 domain-containing protein [Clostridia bacterium]|nr:RNA-binding S4 domain-containing protein [Clostridia bacterium]